MADYDGLKIAQLYPDVYFFNEFSKSTQDFKIVTRENANCRGVSYGETLRSEVFLAGHEVPEDITSTSVHELLHIIFMGWQYYETDDFVMDIDQEHDLIRAARWAEDNFTKKDEYYSIYNNKEIVPEMSEAEYKNFMKKSNKEFKKLLEADHIPA